MKHFHDAGQMALLRFGTGSLALGLYAAYKRIKLPKLRDVPLFFVAGLLGVSIYHVLLNYGQKTVDAGAASLLINSAPVFTALLAYFFLKEKITTRHWVGIIVSFVGIGLIVIGQSKGLRISWQALLIVTSAVCYAGYITLQKKKLAGYSALEFTCFAVWAGTLLLLVFSPGLFQTLARVPMKPIAEVVYLGVFPGALAYLTFAYATKHMPASRVMAFLYLVPPLAMLMAYSYRGERPSWLSIVGGALAIGGVIIVNWARAQRT